MNKGKIQCQVWSEHHFFRVSVNEVNLQRYWRSPASYYNKSVCTHTKVSMPRASTADQMFPTLKGVPAGGWGTRSLRSQEGREEVGGERGG